MVTASSKKPKSKPAKDRRKRVVRFPGLIADARALGVNRTTLYRVLTGEFTHLKGLKARYEALKKQQNQSA